jgi:hypothetical protein
MGGNGAPEGCEGPVRRRSLESFATRPLAGGLGPEGCRPFLFFMPLFTNVLELDFIHLRAKGIGTLLIAQCPISRDQRTYPC